MGYEKFSNSSVVVVRKLKAIKHPKAHVFSEFILYNIQDYFRQINVIVKSDLSRKDKIQMIVILRDAAINDFDSIFDGNGDFLDKYKCFTLFEEEFNSMYTYIISDLDTKFKRACLQIDLDSANSKEKEL